MPCKCMSTVRNIIVMHAGVEKYYDLYCMVVNTLSHIALLVCIHMCMLLMHMDVHIIYIIQ